MKKVLALVFAYAMPVTGLPVELPRGSSADAVDNLPTHAAPALSTSDRSADAKRDIHASRKVDHYKASRARIPSPPSPAMAASTPPNVSTITSNFNGTSIAAGGYIWFNSVMQVSGLGSSPTTITVAGATIQFSANGTAYSINVPDAAITFSPSVTSASTTFDATNNRWHTYVPLSFSQNVFLAGISYPVSEALPGGINPASWTGTFYTDTSGVSLNWQWAAAVYTTFSASENALGVKPVDGSSSNPYANSDHAGTPENFKPYVVGGARGGGGSNWTGSYSGTASVTPSILVSPPVANAGPAQTVALGSTVQLNGTGSTDPNGYPLTYQWSFVSKPTGSNATLSNPTSPTPTFVLDTYGSYTVQLVVSDAKSSSAPSTVVISTSNTAPVANAGPNQSVPTQTKVQLDGSKSTDVDGDPLTYQWSFVSMPTGSTAALSNPTIVNPTFVTDKVGNYVVQLIVNDGHQNSAPSQVTITDSFVSPTANAGPNQSVEVDSTVQLDGSHSTDLQGYPLTYNWSILSTPSGSTAALSDPHAVKPTFKVDFLGTYVIQLIVNDGVANSAATTVTISTGDVAPVPNPGQAQTVTIGTIVTLDGTQSTDSDGQPLTYSWSFTTKPNGSNASLVSSTSSKPSFRADLPGTYVIQLIVNDGFLNSQPATVTISTNDVAPVANPGPNQTVTAVVTVQLDGTGSADSDGQPLTYQWAILSQPTGSSATLSSSTAAKPTFVASVTGTYVIQLIVNDGYLNSQPATVTITVNPPNQPPTVSAGSNQTIVLPGNCVTLNGSASSVQPPGSPVTVQWTELSGPGTVTFSNPTQPVTQACFPSAGVYVVALTATVTATNLSSSAQASITVALPPPPVANAGTNQSAVVNSTVQLKGTASFNPSNLPLSYFWSFVTVPSGSAAALTGATTATPTFVPDLLGVYQVQLLVNNGFENSAPATVQVTVTDQAPTANAGPNQTVNIGSSVTLNGSGSTDVDGHPLTYQWSITSAPQGSVAVLTNPTSVTPTFVVDRVGNYTVQLVVNDGFLNSQPSTVTISTNDVAPVANAGASQTVSVGATVQLDGSRSTDVDGNPLAYSWSFVSVPQGSGAVLSSTTAVQPTFVADRVGSYVVQLIVNDGFLNSSPATVTISTNDVPPVANPGANQTVTAGTLVSVNGGTSTDSDGLALTYQWALLTKPSESTATLSSPNTVSTSFTADLPGNYVVQLIVNDGFLNSQPTTVMISTNDVPPIANPGPNQTVPAGTTVQLDGTGSTSSLNFPLTYKWAILSQPTGGTATLSNPSASQPTSVPNVPGLYVVQLIVNDGFLDSQPQTMTVTATQSNLPPTVSAGPNQTIELPVNTATLNGSASSSAPAGSPVTVQWTQLSGPGTVTFANSTQPVTQGTFPGVGTFVLQLSATVTATQLSNSAQTTVTVAPVNQPPVVTVGPDQTITYPTNTATLTGTATDDGLPVGSTLQIFWTKVLGPGPVIFANPSQPNTQATFSVPGNYALMLSASDGQYTSSATVHIAYVAPTGGGITVSAGADQVIVFPAAVSLSGSASDSNPALAGGLTTTWSMVSGPGTVTFANPNALATSATFSGFGVYDLRLTATDGLFTASSDVKIYAGNVDCTLSNKGTDFWLMFTGILTSEPDSTIYGYPPRQLQFFISSDVATSGTVSVPGQGLNLPFTTTPGQITTLNLPQSVQVTSSDTIEAKGIHVTAQNPVAVYGLNFVPYATDGYLGLPTTTLGTSYLIASYENTTYPQFVSFGTEFGVTATQDNTTVTIVPTAKSATRPANTPFTVQLNQGQTYQLRNSTDYTQLGFDNGPPIDFTGSVVTSDKPVAVFGGHDCTFVPDQSLYCNGLVEQLPPTNLWGQNFVTMPLAEERNGDRFRFITQSDNTHVQVNHQQVAVLGKGQFYEQLVQGPAEISADSAILVVQYAQSDIVSGGGNVDPTMIVVPPFEQFGGSYTINTPTSGWFPTNYINVIAPTSAAQSGGVLLDGTPVPAIAFQPIGTSPFSGAQVQATIGAHTLTAGLPFGVWVYGFKLTDAYGYTGGVCLANGVAGTTVTASTKAATEPITSVVTLNATVRDSFGQPIGGTGVTFSVAGVNSQTTYATTDANGLATLSYTSFKAGSDLITITAGGASDTSSITWVSNGPNQPPVVRAGPNLTISLPNNSAFLNGSVVDDGLPNPPGMVTSTWTELSGPAPVSFSMPNQPQTEVTFSQAGTYVLQLTGNDSQLSTSATTTVVVYPPNQPPVVNPGPDQTLILPYSVFLTFNGTVTDDGLPVGSTLTIQWSELSGPDVATIYSPTTASTTMSFAVPGTYIFQLSASDGQFTTTKSVTAHVLNAVAEASPSGVSGVINTPIPVQGTVTVNGQAPPLGTIVVWELFSGPTGVNFVATFANQEAMSTTFQTNTPGTYKIGLCAGTTANCGFVTVFVTATPPTTPTVAITAPSDGAQVTAPTAITGSVSDGTWTLTYGLKDDFNPINFITLATGSGAVSNGNLATLDPTLLLNGTYVLQLSTVNAANLIATASINVTVARNMKVGVFSLSFNDLTVPVAGIPIQIIRSYDSRDKGLGDFGIGWRLTLANIRVQKSRNLGLNWQETQIMSGFLPQYCLFATDNKTVTVTFPDGRVFTFQTGGTPACQLVGEIMSGTLSFVEQPGPAGTAGATLTAADGGQFVLDGEVPGAATLLGFDGTTYNPTTFVLKTADGTSYTVDQKLGLTAVTDANGNTLTVTPNGIISSNGKSVPFTRDSQGRIVSITDPNGNNLYYAYDVFGDLGTFTDRAGNTTGFLYDNDEDNLNTPANIKHNLTGIIGANGTQLLTNAFDASGRLTGTTDATGFLVSFSNNVAAQTQTVTDRNGNPTTYQYDADGNVTQVTDALGHVTTSTYDANDNKLSETNALNKTSSYTYDANGNRLTETDPLNHTTTYSYNALNKPLTIKDPNGNVTTNTYDANGNLLTTTDANNKTTTNTYTPAGQLGTTKDPLGNVTAFGYDQFGNMVTQKDAAGTVTTYTYDGNANRTSQAVTRTLSDGVTKQTLTTTYAYDGNGKLLKTTYPDNSTAQTVYNSLGQQITTIDALNRQTTYQYNADGNVTLTTYPDKTTENSAYDKNGNRTQFTDRTNVTTIYTYDALNRLTQSQRATTTTNKTSYDAIGQVLTTTDPNSNVTQYAYDDAGRRTKVTDALNHVTTFGYDAARNQTSIKDANSNTTAYTYDNDNRRTQVTYPDNKFETTTYDALGRVTARTDANGKVTQFGYDALGRLTSVAQDAVPGGLNLLTQYSYDEVGDRLTQTDANNHTTSYSYDQRGRRLQRTLPLGQSESYSYDAAGNMLTRTDFNGRTTTYTYDAGNRVLTKTADPYFAQNHIGSAQVTYTYFNTGQRASMTDASGTTDWLQYDINGHPTEIFRPQGELFYTYDPAGNLTRLSAQNNVTYTYDALNRLATASFPDRLNNPLTSTYTYDNVGNLQSVTYPNGVAHSYTYDTRNRLTNLALNKTAAALASYAYTLDAAGHRLSVSELSGRTVNYGYDSLYRLTSETIASDPSGMNGAVSYTYDSVGNRVQKVSTLPGYPGGLTNYNANDQLSTDTYDADGNTTASNGLGYVYDFENHLVQAGSGISIVYDGDGNRVSKTVAGVNTTYLVDAQNPTGYVQVLYESFSGSTSGTRELNHIYVYGLEMIGQTRNYIASFQSNIQQIYYDYDGHGSVRALTDTNGNVTDTYDYDAFGNLIHSATTLSSPTPNNYLFAGEQFDPDLNLYYNRARYLNTSTGRFWTMDADEGDPQSPWSLHKYTYAGADPVNSVDRSGNDFAVDFSIATAVDVALSTFAILSIGAAFNAAYGLSNLPKNPFSRLPDAGVVGFQVTANVGRLLRKVAKTPVEVGLSIGLQFLSVGGGFEMVFPSSLDSIWTYGFYGAFYTLPIGGSGGNDGFIPGLPSGITVLPGVNADFLDAAAYGGGVWNVKTPEDYAGAFECVSGAVASRFINESLRPDATVCSSPRKEDGSFGAYSLLLNRLGSGTSIGTSITNYSYLGSIPLH